MRGEQLSKLLLAVAILPGTGRPLFCADCNENGADDATDLRSGPPAFASAEAHGTYDGPTAVATADLDADGVLDLADAVFLASFLFGGGPAPGCLEAADANNDAALNLTDPLLVLRHLFLGGPEPAAPGPTDAACGLDPDPPGSGGDLGCQAYLACSGA